MITKMKALWFPHGKSVRAIDWKFKKEQQEPESVRCYIYGYVRANNHIGVHTRRLVRH